MAQEYNLWRNLILGATSPFRKGANILAQNWSSALTGKDMSQSQNQGKFLQYLAESLTPEEQQQISEKPFLEAIKSSAGMASTLAPYAKGLGFATPVSNSATPAVKELVKLATKGGIEGSMGGLGYSRQGHEIEDTLKGAGIGLGSEVVLGMLTNPILRKELLRQISEDSKNGIYKASMNIGDTVVNNDTKYLDSLAKQGVKGDDLLNAQDLADEIKSNGGKINPDGTVTLYHATNVSSKNTIESTGKMISKEPNLFFSTSPDGQIKGYGDSVVEFKIPLNKLELDDVFGNEAHLKMASDGVGKSTDVSKYIVKGNSNAGENIIKLANAEDIPNTYSNMLKNISNDTGAKQINFARVIDEALSEGNRGERFISTENLPETPKVSMGLGGKKTYSKQAMLAKRSKTAKRIPITSWDEGILESLKSKR